MRKFKCIFGCGVMKIFVAPFVWRKEEEGLEIVITARGLVCEKCWAFALDPREGVRIQKAIQEALQEEGSSHA